MAKLYVRESETFTIDGEDYTFTQYPAMKGLKYITTLQQDGMSPELVRDMIVDGVSKDNKAIDAKLFDSVFAGKLGHLMNVWNKLNEYQFDDVFQESASEE